MNVAPSMPLGPSSVPAAQPVPFNDRAVLDGSFAALLTDHPDAKAQDLRLFAFKELGVLGRGQGRIMAAGSAATPIEWNLKDEKIRLPISEAAGPLGSPAHTGLHRAPHVAMRNSEAASTATVEAPAQALASTVPAQAPSESPRGFSIDAEAASDVVRQPEAVRPNPANAHVKPATNAGPMEEFCEARWADEGEPCQPGRAMSSLRSQSLRNTSNLSLAISGPPDALMIVARATSETAEERLQLRKLIEELAREFGMCVAEFHLNGHATRSSIPSILGDRHGAQRN